MRNLSLVLVLLGLLTPIALHAAPEGISCGDDYMGTHLRTAESGQTFFRLSGDAFNQDEKKSVAVAPCPDRVALVRTKTVCFEGLNTRIVVLYEDDIAKKMEYTIAGVRNTAECF